MVLHNFLNVLERIASKIRLEKEENLGRVGELLVALQNQLTLGNVLH
jgi:hypothetical protein